MMEATPEPTKKKKSFFSRFRRSKKRQEEVVTPPPPLNVEETPTKDVGHLGYPDASPETPPLTPEHGHTYSAEDEQRNNPALVDVVEEAEGTIDAEEEDELDKLINKEFTVKEEEDELAELNHPDQAKTRDGVPVITSLDGDRFRPSDVHDCDITFDGSQYGKDEANAKNDHSFATRELFKNKSVRKKKGTMVLKQAPSARESAYSGPPRYDWIDIETAAAVKVQAAYRRNKVMWDLEEQGLSTAAMRNRRRALKARKYNKMHVSEDTPSLLRFCGVGFVFGDATEEDVEVKDQLAREEYEKKKKEREEAEINRRKWRSRKKADQQLVEEVEVVDDYELGQQ